MSSKLGSLNFSFSDEDSGGEERPVVTGNRQLVLQFFNEASVGEFAAIGGCSKKKAEMLVQLRPFTDWNDIVSALCHQLVNLAVFV